MDNELVIGVEEPTSTQCVKTSSRRKKQRCRVVSYNKYSGVIVYKDSNGQLVQTSAIKYDGSGYVTV